jgi:hypothetical protein
MMFVTPDNNDDNNQHIDDLADDEDYDPMPVSTPPPKSRPKKVARNQNSEPKLILDRNFMWFLQPHTFDHEPFRRGKKDMYPIAKMERFNANFCMQLHFNFLATLSLAHNEWLELNNTEFAMYPSVRTLERHELSGTIYRPYPEGKMGVETIYSPGAIAPRIVHRSGTGSKGNGSPEKKLICEVIGLFLRNPFDKNNGGRVLAQGFMMTLGGLITTKLDRKKLDQERTFIQHKDSAGILLNGVNHIYGRISVSREREKSSKNDKVTEGINGVIDEIMEYEPGILVPDIDDHMFSNEDSIDDDGADDKEQEITMEISRVMTRPCLPDLVEVGWNNLKEMNVNKISMVADERTQRKRTTTKYIVDRVKTMREDLMSASIPVEQADVEESEWVKYMQELRSNYYK